MPKDVQFPQVEPLYVFERDCLSFPAIADGKPLECLVSLELLMTRFGAEERTEQAMRQAFRENRGAITAIARSHIENDWIDDENQVSLTTRFARLTVQFDESIAKDQKVLDAHRILLGIIGPQAGEVLVRWFTSPEYPPNPSILLSVRDPVIRREISTALPLRAWSDPSVLHVRLARVWSALLSARSDNLVLKSG